jgi:hypothetical protein
MWYEKGEKPLCSCKQAATGSVWRAIDGTADFTQVFAGNSVLRDRAARSKFVRTPTFVSHAEHSIL